jgi:heptosyltransferase-2/heptosyltransferase-3
MSIITMNDDHPLVCRFGALGDMVLLTPLLRQLYLRSGLPCDVVSVGGWNRSLFAEMPWVRNVYSIDSRSAPYWFNRSQRELVHKLRQEQHRFVWVCETSDKSYRLLARAGITRANSINQLDLEPVAGEHYCDKWLRLGNLNPPGFDAQPLAEQPSGTQLFVSRDETLECRSWLQKRGLDSTAPLLCIQAGSKRTTRRGRANRASNSKYWHESLWAELIDAIAARLPGVQVMLCGVAAESDMCDAIKLLCSNQEQVHNVADDLPLRRLLALLSMAHSCISVDTGPAHAAAALDCPLVVLFGKASPARFRPVSRTSPVQVIQGFTDQASDASPDIRHITVQQAFVGWCDASLEQPSQ